MYNENLFIIYMRQIFVFVPSFGKKCRTRTGFCNFNEYINVKEDKISKNSLFRLNN